jgi:ribonuclease HI
LKDRKTAHAYTDGSKSDSGVGAGIAIFLDNSLRATLKYRLNGCCSKNQAEQRAILKALEHIQLLKAGEKSVLVYTDSRITLQLLQNQTKHAHIIEQIRVKVIEMEQQEWKVEFSWIKAHTRRTEETSWQTNWPKKQQGHWRVLHQNTKECSVE